MNKDFDVITVNSVYADALKGGAALRANNPWLFGTITEADKMKAADAFLHGHRADLICCGDVVKCQNMLHCAQREAYREYAKTDDIPVPQLSEEQELAIAKCEAALADHRREAQAKINEATHGLATGPTFLSDATAMLTTDSAARKNAPVFSGVMKYFPKALAAIARLSKIGNDKHNPGEPLHWSRGKSDDHGDCVARHQLEAGTIDTDGELHDTKVAWRALAQLEIAIEKLHAQGIDY